MSFTKDSSIGVFDSGIGGMTILKEIVELMPNESIVYYADSANCPYGNKEEQQVIDLVMAAIESLIFRHHVKIVVVACNTATTNTIAILREKYPHINFIGTEPAIKVAANSSCSGVIGVLATRSTINSEKIHSLINRYAHEQQVIEQHGDGLVSLIEEGREESQECYDLLDFYLRPMLEKGIDNLVLGCTHYPFLMPQIQKTIGSDSHIRLINPAPAIAKQTKHILTKESLLTTNSGLGTIIFDSSKDDAYNRQMEVKFYDYLNNNE